MRLAQTFAAALVLAVVVQTSAPATVPASAAAAVVLTAADIRAALGRLSPQFTDDEPQRVFDAGPNRLGLFVVGRPRKTGPGQRLPAGATAVTKGLPLDQVTTVVQVLSGAGEFITGGTLLAPTRMPASDPDAAVIGPGSRARAIVAGERRRISTGDVVVIPAGLPHGFAVIESPITYLVIRIDSGHVLLLK